MSNSPIQLIHPAKQTVYDVGRPGMKVDSINGVIGVCSDAPPAPMAFFAIPGRDLEGELNVKIESYIRMEFLPKKLQDEIRAIIRPGHTEESREKAT